MMKTSTHMNVAPMETSAEEVQGALVAMVETLYRRDRIGDRVTVYFGGLVDGHYSFMLTGIASDVERVIRDWQAMDEERIG